MLALLLSLLLAVGPLQDASISWMCSLNDNGGDEYELVLSGDVADGCYTHPLTAEYSSTSLDIETSAGVELIGGPVESYSASLYKGETVVSGKYVLSQKLKLNGAPAVVGTVCWQVCSGDSCFTPEEYSFNVPVTTVSQAEPENEKDREPVWPLIIQAILWGFAMLLTPCVFPMVPMTVSFFLKSSENKAQGRFRAFIYGLSIVLLYTLPICVIIGATWLIGGESVTADIFNWLATHWIPNLIFFVVFMVFAASFFGAFEIVLPSKWVNGSDKNSGKGGLAGVFFLALTLVLVSFSCTGPIVGTVLIKSTGGEFRSPMAAMLAFSIAFALPFTLLALFPSLLKSLPKSGSWLNSVKVVLGFIEVALGFKFLSVADQTYHWGILDREVYLAIWIACFLLLGLYLIGMLRFKNDDELKYISVPRLALAIADFAFVMYLIPGMWGAPLKALSGYLPPIETQDFVIAQYQPAAVAAELPAADEVLALPHGLSGYGSIEDGLAAAKKLGRPVLVDITGLGCVNCREMEARVWSDPQVLALLRDKFVIVSLNTDDKTRLPESQWLTTPEGKVLKDVGRVNSYVVRERFGVNAQPNYVILSEEGEQLVPVRGYDLSVPAYVEFLNSGLK